MVKQLYPRVEINIGHLRANAETVVNKCAEFGIDVAGVIKGATGDPEVAKAYEAGGAKWIASSRLEQLEEAIEAGVKKPTMLIRVPMLSEVKDVIKIADYSLVSEITVIRALNAEAIAQGKIHNVIVMADMGDLREGYWDKDEMADVCYEIETELKGLHFMGIGTNLGCYGSINPTYEKLEELVAVAEKIEAKIGRKMEIISGGATTTLPRIWEKKIPERINMLRVGEGVLLARDLEIYYGCPQPELYKDDFRLKAEVIEVKTKPSHPVGEIAVDAFGHRPTYVDRGMRKKALLGIGKVDYGDPGELVILEEGIEVLGASSDHTILDITDAKKDYKVGDIIEFGINYATMVYLTNCKNVTITYVNK